MDLKEVREIEDRFCDAVLGNTVAMVSEDRCMTEKDKMFLAAFEAVQDLRKYLQKEGGERSGREQAEDIGSVAPGIAGDKASI